jgi:AraC-like DNA-binding protein
MPSRACGRAQSPGDLDLAVLAAEAGFADQAHLTRECGRLSGLTPAALARQRRREDQRTRDDHP